MIVIKLILKITELLLGFVATYIIASLYISEIPVNSNFTPTPSGVPIYIQSNGIHTDIVVPIENSEINWRNFVNPIETKSKSNSYNWIAFGWGNKGFYLETPTWAELKLSVALNAIFGLSETAMHLTFYIGVKESKLTKKVMISKAEYQLLIKEIKMQFLEEKPIRIPNASYGINDSFYNAKDTYSLLKTCNTWANSTLKNSGIKACLWTPVDAAILRKH